VGRTIGGSGGKSADEDADALLLGTVSDVEVVLQCGKNARAARSGRTGAKRRARM